MDTADLLARIRVSGVVPRHVAINAERRISNFFLWQLAYTELFVTKVLWPDFGRRDLYGAILDFQNRERRFGRVTA